MLALQDIQLTRRFLSSRKICLIKLHPNQRHLIVLALALTGPCAHVVTAFSPKSFAPTPRSAIFYKNGVRNNNGHRASVLAPNPSLHIRTPNDSVFPAVKSNPSYVLFQRPVDFRDAGNRSSTRLFAAKQWLARFLHNLGHTLQWMKRRWKVAFLSLVMFWALCAGPAFAGGSGGRSGGSFKRAPSPSYSRPAPSRSYSRPPVHYSRPPVRVYMPPPRVMYHNPRPHVTVIHGPSNYQPYGPVDRKPISAKDVAFVVGAGALVAYGVSTQLTKERDENSSALGPGVSVSRITVSLSVPDRDAPDSILKRLQQLSSNARTNTREGVQQLVSNGMYL